MKRSGSVPAVVLGIVLFAGCGEAPVHGDHTSADRLSVMPQSVQASLLLPPPREPPAPPPDVPALGDPGSPAAEIVARFAEYQAAFRDQDGRRFLSLHTAAEQRRQITTCIRILTEPARRTGWIDDILTNCGATDGIRIVARAYDPADPIAVAAAVQTIHPRLQESWQLVSAALEYLQASGTIEPQLVNLSVAGNGAEADLVLRSVLAGNEERSRLTFALEGDGWYISGETPIPAPGTELVTVTSGMP